jgi:hypothetical protein
MYIYMRRFSSRKYSNRRKHRKSKSGKANFRRLKKNKTLKLKGGGNLHYLISSHGTTKGVTSYTTPHTTNPNVSIYTYTEYDTPLSVSCAYDLQTWLASHRDKPDSIPKCSKETPYIDEQIKNANLYVTRSDSWISGILDITKIGEPRTVETWTHTDKSYERGYTLNEAIDTILADYSANYRGTNTIKIHVLTCL